MLEFAEAMRSISDNANAVPPVTALDMPIEVRRLLKSYAFEDLHWGEPQDRYTIVIEILTRGDDAAERWVWSMCTHDEIRDLFRHFGGAGCGDNDARALLRQKMGLTVEELPDRPFAPFPWRGWRRR